MTTPISIDPYDEDGIFIVMVEGARQGPIILEAEPHQTSRAAAEARTSPMGTVRKCVCRVVPVSGNELLPLDMIRMQKS